MRKFVCQKLTQCKKAISEYDREIPHSHIVYQPKVREEEPHNTKNHKTPGIQLN